MTASYLIETIIFLLGQQKNVNVTTEKYGCVSVSIPFPYGILLNPFEKMNPLNLL